MREQRWLFDRLIELKAGKNFDRHEAEQEFGELCAWAKSAGILHARIEAEIAFYKGLYKYSPEQKFRFRLKSGHNWSDGEPAPNVIAFECPPGKTVLYTKFQGYGKQFEISLIQGEKGADFSLANKALGRPWHEAFMGRIIESHAPLRKLGIELHQFRDTTARLPLIIRDHYFERRGIPGAPTTHRLNPKRKRVQMHLRPR